MSATFLTDIDDLIFKSSVRPAVIASATTTNGTFVDLLDADGQTTVEVYTGDSGDATLTLDVKLQEAIEDTASLGNPLSSDWSDISGSDFTQLAGATAADNVSLAKTVNNRSKRFVRAVVVTAGGGTLSVPIAVVIKARKKLTGGNGAYTAF